MVESFVAYPSQPSEIGATIKAAIALLKSDFGISSFSSWEENDIPGRFLADPILQSIKDGDALVADVTKLNFNVTFEIGYAIGVKRRTLLVRHGAV
jgi:hypothetical protein